MWPWGHLAVGYLLYWSVAHARRSDSVTDREMLSLAVGTQLPDVVDKPLAYWFLVLPEGRSLGHSLLAAVPLCLVAVWVARRHGRGGVGGAFAIGYLSHLLGDSWEPLLAGHLSQVSYLLWPLLDSPDFETSSFAQHLSELLAVFRAVQNESLSAVLTHSIAAQFALAAFTVVLWVADGAPGIPNLRASR